jgi:hypothetical protein
VIVQFTRFRVAAGREPGVLEARRASLRACHGSEPRLRGAYLVRLQDGEWLDITVWAAPPDADAFDDPAQAASRTAFYGQIDELLGEECGVLVDDAASQPSGFAGAGHGERGPVSYRP